jgi:hypothetical protein
MHNYLLKRFRAVTRQQSMSLQSLQRATVKVSTLKVHDFGGFWTKFKTGFGFSVNIGKKDNFK